MRSIGKGINYFSLFAFSLKIAMHSNSKVKCKKPQSVNSITTLLVQNIKGLNNIHIHWLHNIKHMIILIEYNN